MALNTISWLFIGKQNALDLSLNFYDDFSSGGSVSDTLFVYSTYTISGEIFETVDFGSIQDNYRESFFTKLTTKSNKSVKFIDDTTNLFSEYESGNSNFHVSLDYIYPFYLYVSSGYAAFGNAAINEQHYYWFFYWWPIGEAGGGIT